MTKDSPTCYRHPNAVNIGVEVVVYCTYGDESRDETGSRVYAVSGVFGHQEDWAAIEGPWKDRLAGKVFHAADCEFGLGEFANLAPGEGRRLYRDLTDLIVKSKLLGHASAINVTEYKEAFPNDFEHSPYLWAFGDIVQQMAELASVAMPVEQVQITFDRNQDIEYNATEIYNLLRYSRKHKTREFLFDTVAFACRRTVGIQVADLFAREAMKRLDGQIPPEHRTTRASFAALRRANKFAFLAVGKKDFEDKRRKLLNSPFRDSATLTEYRKWLTANGLIDNLSNSVHHLQNFPELWDYET